jgi:hypothetical protein
MRVPPYGKTVLLKRLNQRANASPIFGFVGNKDVRHSRPRCSDLTDYTGLAYRHNSLADLQVAGVRFPPKPDN